jgi:hypothetical protein
LRARFTESGYVYMANHADCNCSNAPCDCDEPVVPGTALALSAGTSQIASTRISKGDARALARYCSTNNCSQSSVLRQFVVQLAKGGAAADPNEQLAAVRAALGLGKDASRAEIAETVDALFTLIGGDPADAPADGDPLAAAAEPKPPANPLATLSKTEQAFCIKHKLSAAQFAAKKASAVRRVASAKPARAALSRAVDAPAVAVRPFTREEIAWGERHQIPRAELRATLAARAAKATRRSGQ